MLIILRIRSFLSLYLRKIWRYRILGKRKRAYLESKGSLFYGGLIEVGSDKIIYDGLEEEVDAVMKEKRRRRQQARSKRLEARRDKLKADIELLKPEADDLSRHAEIKAEVEALKRERNELIKTKKSQ